MAKRAKAKRSAAGSTKKAKGTKKGGGSTTKTWSTRPKSLSLHLGLNSVSPAHYGGWSGELTACEFDANDMAAIARASRMKPTVLLTRRATRANALAAIRGASKSLKAG